VANSAQLETRESPKRRSSRIVQAVPLSVTGVDALGRPFLERTSTIVVSCHGCCYQSKHYVLKNMWVTLEVPQWEGDRSPRHVRGRVTWVQRPVGVRELFQIGVELEIPGNLWGIAFAPPDWIPFPDINRQEIAIPSLEPAESASHADTAEQAKADAASRDHLRMVPSVGAGELSAALARHMELLVGEAKQHLHETIRESATRTLSAEARPLVAALYAQFQEAERRATPGSDNAPDTPGPHTPAQAGIARPDSLKICDEVGEELESRLQGLREQWNREISESARQASERLAAELGQLEQERRGQFEQRVESKLRQTIDNLEWAAGEARSKVAHAQEHLAGLRKQAEEAAAPLRAIEESLRAQAEISRVQFAGSETAARHFEERIAFALDKAQSAFEKGTTHAQESLAQISSLAAGMEEQGSKFGALALSAQENFERGLSELMETSSRELERRASESIATWAEHLQPALETARQQTVARLGADLERELGAHLARAGEALGRLHEGIRHAEATPRAHEDRLMKASERATETAIERLEKVAHEVKSNLEQSAKALAAKSLEEIDSKATEATQATFEALFKTAEWYEKKVHAQIQAGAEKSLTQTAESLREKASETFRLLGAELDHYSRNYVEHTQSQFAEGARENLELISRQAAEIAATASASLAEEARAHIEVVLAELRSRAGGALSDVAASMENHAAAIRATLESEARRFSSEFRGSLTQQTDQAAARAQQALAAEAKASRDDLRMQGELQVSELRQAVTSMGNQAIDEFSKRLTDASDSWLSGTIVKLNEESKERIESLAKTAESRLREACGTVFASVAETLRRRLLEPVMPPADRPREEPISDSQSHGHAESESG
jgi:hypothetical protein